MRGLRVCRGRQASFSHARGGHYETASHSQKMVVHREQKLNGSSVLDLILRTRLNAAREPTIRQIEAREGQEVNPILAAHVVDRADVRVTERGERLGLAFEPLLQVRIGGHCDAASSMLLDLR